MNNKIKIAIIIVLVLALSQWLIIKMIYAHNLPSGPSQFLASVYRLKAGTIKDGEDNINVYLKDFLTNQSFAKKLLEASPDKLDISDEELSDLVWGKLLKQTWLKKTAKENDIEIGEDDAKYYIDAIGGEDRLKEIISTQDVSLDEYKYFLIDPDILEAKVYDYLIANFQDEDGVLRIQEAYALLESEEGANWDEVAEEYDEDPTLSANSFWLSEEELVDVYEPIQEIEVGGFSKILQIPIGYIIWHLESIVEEDDKSMREIKGLFVYAQNVDDFFDKYLENVDVKKIY
jgi:hypothetical protein